MSQRRAKDDPLRELVREQPGHERAVYWRLAKLRGTKKSTFYLHWGKLHKKGVLTEVLGPHRSRFFLRKSDPFANPDYVKDLLEGAMTDANPQLFRKSAIEDLRLLAREKPILIDGDLLSFFEVALNDVDGSLSGATFDILGEIAKRYSTAVAEKNTSLGADAELQCLWSGIGGTKGIGKPLIKLVADRPDHATWALNVLGQFAGITLLPSALIELALMAAFSKVLTKAAFENLEPTVLNALMLGLKKDPESYAQLREQLQRHLASQDEDENSRARQLWDFLRPKFIEHFARSNA